MGLFKSKQVKELEEMVARVDMNMKNNYKDAAQSDFKEFEKKLEEYSQSGALKPQQQKAFEEQRDIYKKKLKGFSHAEQRASW